MDIVETNKDGFTFRTNANDDSNSLGSDGTLSLLEKQKLRIQELESDINLVINECESLREKVHQSERALDQINVVFNAKIESKEKELKQFLFPSPPRPNTSESEPLKSNNHLLTGTNKSTISSIRPVPTLISGPIKPVDSLLGSNGPLINVRKSNSSGGGLLPTPYPNPLLSSGRSVTPTLSTSQSHLLAKPLVGSENKRDIAIYMNVAVDPAVNLVFSRLCRTQKNFDHLVTANQAELQSFTFTQNSQNGKRMMMRIRVLEQENEELANTNRTGRAARLETEIALRRQFVSDLKQAHSDMEYLIEETEAETENLANSLLMLQQRLQLASNTIEVFASALDELDPECCARVLECHSWTRTTELARLSLEPTDTSLSKPTEIEAVEPSINDSSYGNKTPVPDSINEQNDNKLSTVETVDISIPRPPCNLPLNEKLDESSPIQSRLSTEPLAKKPRQDVLNDSMSPQDLLKSNHNISDPPFLKRSKERPIIPVRGPQRTFSSSTTTGRDSQTPTEESLERTNNNSGKKYKCNLKNPQDFISHSMSHDQNACINEKQGSHRLKKHTKHKEKSPNSRFNDNDINNGNINLSD